MRIIHVAIFFAILFLSYGTAQKNTQPNEPQRNGASDPKNIPPNTNVVNVSNCVPVNAEQSQTQTSKTKSELPRWIPFMSNDGLVMAALTLAYVIVTWRGLKAIKRQADIAEKTA